MAIQQKSIGESNHFYYIIDTLAREMRLLVPVRQAQSLGLRSVGEEGKLRNALAHCKVAPQADDISSDLRARQSEMRERLKSGRYTEVADVVRTLFFLNARRPLGTVDRQLFDQGKEFLASELALACDSAIEIALREVEETLACMLEKE